MQWILGREESPLLLAEDPGRDWNSFLATELSREELCYGGFLWSDILDLPQTIERLHSRLCFDFQAGWSAVGFVLREGGSSLGPWTAPTTARPHARAPLGLYLLSPLRLRASLPTPWESTTTSEHLCRLMHSRQRELGLTFCDPNLELKLPSGERDFQYQTPSRWQVLRRAAKFLVAPEGAS